MLEHLTKLNLSDLLLSPLVAAAKLVIAPGSRTYWPYLLVSLLIAVVFWLREKRNNPALPDHLNVFSAQTWGSVSAREDYWIVFLNVVLVMLFIGAMVPNAAQSVSALSGLFPFPAGGYLGEKAIDPWLSGLLLAFALFIVDDFLRFFMHWCEHRVGFLWELHKVHHSARVLNFVTAERHHPLSILIASLMFASGAIVVNLAFVLLLGKPGQPLYWLGANVFWVVSNLLAAALRHSPVWFSYGPLVERWIISPAQHQIHHSESPQHFGKNLGSFFSVWDRLFGTLLVTGKRREILTFGLGDENFSGSGFKGLYWRPLRRIFRV